MRATIGLIITFRSIFYRYCVGLLNIAIKLLTISAQQWPSVRPKLKPQIHKSPWKTKFPSPYLTFLQHISTLNNLICHIFVVMMTRGRCNFYGHDVYIMIYPSHHKKPAPGTAGKRVKLAPSNPKESNHSPPIFICSPVLLRNKAVYSSKVHSKDHFAWS